MIPTESDLWLLPLGGCGEIGMNLNLYGHDGRWLIVDCGITFANPGEPGPHIQMPDPSFIAERRSLISALLVTHAHEDHVGAVAHLWPRLQCPVYTTPFTAAILTRKLSEAGLLHDVPLHVVTEGRVVQLDGFEVEWLAITHSTPQTCALVIRTPAGRVFHTADWKLDPDPVVGAPYDSDALRRLADEPVQAIVCDSTNALTPGRSVSEGDLYEPLREIVASCASRVIVGCFGSNVARLATLARVAVETGRYAGVLGRSLRNYLQAAHAASLWKSGYRLIEPAHLGYLPREEVLAVATGSQGEPGAALDRLAANTHPDLTLESGDTVIFSSRVIPGNEAAVATLARRLKRRGARVIQAEDLNVPIHASGHPAREELADMYRWVKPWLAIPVHGEEAHMSANAEIARAEGVPRTLQGRNGDLFMVAPVPGIRRNAARVGRLGLDNGTLVRTIAASAQGV